MRPVIKLILILMALLYLNSHVFGKVESSISTTEAAAIQKLRTRVSKHLTQDYMNDDHYLLRFLREKRLNVDSATDMIMRGLVWRKEHKIDSILDKKFEYEKYFPYDLFEDRDGRPAAAARVSDYKFRRYIIAGKRDQLVGIIYKMAEFAMFKMREASAKTGTNITNGIIIGDVSGFNFREHVCTQCVELGIEMLKQYESNYPQTAFKLIAVNAPRLAVTVYDTYKNLATEYLRNAISVYGYNKNEWVPELLKLIKKEQLPIYLGGTSSAPRNLGIVHVGEWS